MNFSQSLWNNLKNWKHEVADTHVSVSNEPSTAILFERKKSMKNICFSIWGVSEPF